MQNTGLSDGAAFFISVKLMAEWTKESAENL